MASMASSSDKHRTIDVPYGYSQSVTPRPAVDLAMMMIPSEAIPEKKQHRQRSSSRHTNSTANETPGSTREDDDDDDNNNVAHGNSTNRRKDHKKRKSSRRRSDSTSRPVQLNQMEDAVAKKINAFNQSNQPQSVQKQVPKQQQEEQQRQQEQQQEQQRQQQQEQQHEQQKLKPRRPVTIHQMEEIVAQKVNTDHKVRSSISQQQKQLEDDKKMMRVTSTRSPSRKMNRDKSSTAGDSSSDAPHVRPGSSSRKLKNRKGLHEVVDSRQDHVVKPLSVRSLPLPPQQQSARLEDDRHNSWEPGTSRRLHHNKVPRQSSSKRSIASMSFASQDFSETTMTTATMTTTSKQQGRKSSRSPPRQPYRTKFGSDASALPQQTVAGLNYAVEGSVTKYGTPRPMDAAISNQLDNNGPLRHPGGIALPFPEEERIHEPARLQRLYGLEDDLLLKGHVSAPNDYRARDLEAHWDQDSVYSNIPPPPAFYRETPLPTITRRVTKDAPVLEPTDSLQPGAYRAGGWQSNHSDDNDSDDQSLTYSERLMNLSEAERQREEARSIEMARNHLLSCHSLQVSQELTYESQSQGTGLGASTFLDEDRRPEQQQQSERKSGTSLACRLGIALVVALVIGAVVGVVVGLKGNADSSQTGSSGGSGNGDCVYDLKLVEQCQAHGAVSDIPSCVQSRYQAIQQELELQGIGSIDSCSAGNMGLLSMASANQQMYVSNYVLSTLFFSTSGPSKWDKSSSWATESSVCDWEGVTCKLSCKIDKNSSRSCELDPEEVVGISLNKDGLNGKIPSELGLLSALETLTLSANSLTGEVPAELGNLSKMTLLDLSLNEMSGSIPSTIAYLTSLQDFRMTSSRMTGAIPTEIGMLTSLTELDLSINNLNGQLPSELGNLSGLEHLKVDQNSLEGKIPIELSKCLKLEILSASQNSLTGFIPTEIGLLTSLSILSIGSNAYDAQQIPTEILQLSRLSELSCPASNLSGEFPSQLANMTGLKLLDVQQNSLIGSIPSEVSLLKSLSVMKLDGNQFDGSIPSEIGNMGNLTSFTLARNHFTGSLPSELGKLTQLVNLVLSVNNFVGTIPTEVCLLWDHDLMSLSEPGMSCEKDFYGGATCPTVQCCRFCTV